MSRWAFEIREVPCCRIWLLTVVVPVFGIAIEMTRVSECTASLRINEPSRFRERRCALLDPRRALDLRRILVILNPWPVYQSYLKAILEGSEEFFPSMGTAACKCPTAFRL